MTQATAVAGTSLSQGFINGRVLVVAGAVVGFFILPPLARAAPQAVNWLLLLILLGSIVTNQARWIPVLTRLATAARPAKAP